MMNETVKLGVQSHINIGFDHVLDTGMPRDEWDELTADERNSCISDAVWDILDVWVIEDE